MHESDGASRVDVPTRGFLHFNVPLTASSLYPGTGGDAEILVSTPRVHHGATRPPIRGQMPTQHKVGN